MCLLMCVRMCVLMTRWRVRSWALASSKRGGMSSDCLMCLPYVSAYVCAYVSAYVALSQQQARRHELRRRLAAARDALGAGRRSPRER